MCYLMTRRCFTGTALLVLTVTDTSAESYYGEQGLHYVGTDGESCLVPRGRPVMRVIQCVFAFDLFPHFPVFTFHIFFLQPRTDQCTMLNGIPSPQSSAWFTAVSLFTFRSKSKEKSTSE